MLVAGFSNELAPSYLTVWDQTLRLEGLNVSVIRPHSSKSVSQNVDYLKTQFKKISKKHKKRLVVVGHSKGGLESVATLLKHPELAENVIEKVVAVQSPLCGCELGERGYNLVSYFYNGTYINGLSSLTNSEVRAMTIDQIHSMPDALAHKLSAKILYVVSEKDRSEHPTVIKLLSTIVGHTPNGDGLVHKREMFIEGFGEIIFNLKADHMELAVPPMIGFETSSVEKNQDFILNLLGYFKKKSVQRAQFCRETFLAIYNPG
ncbi:MAG: hypothetical protein IPM57_11335 [Oligoflexia bacterium]|nr:hypothetical protein [Oligoflexia bacterium]